MKFKKTIEKKVSKIILIKLKIVNFFFKVDDKMQAYNPYEVSEKTMSQNLRMFDARYLMFKSLRQTTGILFPEVLNKLECDQITTDFIICFFATYGIKQSQVYEMEKMFQEERELEFLKFTKE